MPAELEAIFLAGGRRPVQVLGHHHVPVGVAARSSSLVTGKSGSVGEGRLAREETVTLNFTGGCLIPALELRPTLQETERDRLAPVGEHQSALGHAAAR